MSRSRVSDRLSLSQRERIKVRDSSGSALPAQFKSLEGHYQVLAGPGDSKNERRQFRFCAEIALVRGPVLRLSDNHGQNHPTRSQVLGPDNRNPGHTDRLDTVAEIYIDRGYGFANAAREYVHSRSRFFEDNERESRGGSLDSAISCGEINRPPLTLILSPRAGRGEWQACHPSNLKAE